MKTKTITTTTQTGLAALLGSALSAVAIERPPSIKSEPLRAEKVSESQLAPDQLAQKEPVNAKAKPWLGVSGDPIHGELAWHLDIDGGVQLRLVIPDSPADVLGLKPGAIITKLNGEPVYAQDDLRDAILKHKPGAEVTLSWIQKGKSFEKKVTLGKRDLVARIDPEQSTWNQTRRGIHPRPIPPHGMNLNDNIRRQIEDMQRQFDAYGLRSQGDLQLRFDDLLGQMQNDGGSTFDFGLKSSSNTGSITFQDSEGSVEMRNEDGKRSLTIHDHEGKVLFTGPYNTEEEKAALSENLRERVKKLGIDGESGRMFQFDFNGRGFNAIPDPDQLPEPSPRKR